MLQGQGQGYIPQPPIVEVPVQAPVRDRKPKHSLAHPNKFDGSDLSTYPAFRGYLKVKYRIDVLAIRGETE